MEKKVKVIALLKAKAGMSLDEFKKYYLENHAPLDLKFKYLRGYTFSLALENYPDQNNDRLYDGIAELWWDSIEDMEADFNSPEGKDGGKDASSFTREIISIYTEEFEIKPRS